MGRKTFESLPTYPKGLPNRINYVITSKGDGEQENGIFFIKIDEFPTLKHKEDTVWIIGGASIYKHFLSFVDEVHHTTINGIYDCDTFFDMNFLALWKLKRHKDLADNADLHVWTRNT